MADVASLIFDIDSSQAEGAAKALAGLNRYAAATATATAKLETTVRGANGRFKSFVDHVADSEQEVRKLAASYNPVLNAQLRFAEAQKDVARAVQLGVISSSQQADVLRRLQSEYSQSASMANGFTKAQSNGAMQSANVFAQLNDIGVMLAAGQNPFQLAMQQGTQLNQVWASMGAQGRTLGGVARMLGGAVSTMISPMSLLTIGTIAGTAALVNWATSTGEAGKEAKTFGDSLSALQSGTDRLTGSLKALGSDGIEAAYEAYGRFNEEVRRSLVLMTEAAIFSEMEKIRVSAAALKEEMTGGWLTSDIDDVRRLFGTTNDNARYLLSIMTEIDKADTLTAQAEAAKKLRDELLSGGRSIESYDGAARAALIKVIELADAADRHAVATARARDAAKQFGEVDMASGVTAAGSAALVLAQRLNISLDTARKLAALGDQGVNTNPDPSGKRYGGRGGDPRAMGGSALDVQVYGADQWLKAWEEAQKKGGGGGGGGAALKQAEKQFQSLRELLEKDSQFQVAEYEKRQEQLDNALSKRLVSEQQYEEMRKGLKMYYFGSEYEQAQLNYDMSLEQLKLALENEYLTREQYEDRIAQLNAQRRATELGHYNTFFGNMASAAKAGGDKATGVVKAFSIAQGLLNSYLAYTQVLADPSLIGRPFLRTALAASTLASGLAQVANMKGGGSGGASSATSAASGAPAEPNRYVYVELDGPDWMVDMAENIMDQIYQASSDGRIIVSRA